LRHPTLSPNDMWEEVCDYATAHRVSDDQAFNETFQKRILTLAPDAEPVEVDSAFGGLGIYKIRSLLKNKREYVGQKIKMLSVDASLPPKFMAWQCCDHVSFNLGLRELGEKLFVLPFLMNFDTARWRFRPSAWHEMLSEIRRNQACPCNSGERYKHCHGKNL